MRSIAPCKQENILRLYFSYHPSSCRVAIKSSLQKIAGFGGGYRGSSLYCTVLYCTVLYCTSDTSPARRGSQGFFVWSVDAVIVVSIVSIDPSPFNNKSSMVASLHHCIIGSSHGKILRAIAKQRRHKFKRAPNCCRFQSTQGIPWPLLNTWNDDNVL